MRAVKRLVGRSGLAVTVSGVPHCETVVGTLAFCAAAMTRRQSSRVGWLALCCFVILGLRWARHTTSKMQHLRDKLHRSRERLHTLRGRNRAKLPPRPRPPRPAGVAAAATDIAAAGDGYVRYEASELEMLWANRSARGRICELARDAAQVALARGWLAYSERAFRPDGARAPPADGGAWRALSRFRARDGTLEPIEPLTGVARHPFAHVFQHFHRDGLNAESAACASRARPSGAPALVDPLDISYLVVHNACDDPPEARAARKVVFFDLGASSGFAGVRGGVPAAMPQRGGSITASIPLFWRLYRERCLEFDEVWAWEVEPHVTEAQWWGELPPALRAKVRFYPTPVAQDRRASAGEGGGGGERGCCFSFLEILRETVARDDYVVLKVDIDTPEIELNVVEALAARPELAALVDELFFEYHFYFDGHDFGWGPQDAAALADVDDALLLMRRLRQQGIRAHFWI